MLELIIFFNYKLQIGVFLAWFLKFLQYKLI